MENRSLQRFLEAQEKDYFTALTEIRSGKKRSHWIWYIFPQVQGLGFSETSRYYGIQDMAEAEAYLQHPVLGARLTGISAALLGLQTNDARSVLGSPDDLKLFSSMTLFSQVRNAPVIFQQVLDKFFAGKKDERTLQLLYGRS